MTTASKNKWAVRTYWTIVLLGVILGVSALARDYQTRQLIDRPAREAARKLCISGNARWNAYLTAAVAASNERAAGETDEAYAARKARTERIVQQIRKVVTVNCSEAFK